MFLNYNFNKERCMLPEDDRVIETCRFVLSVLMYVLDLLNNIYVCGFVFYLNKLQNAWCNERGNPYLLYGAESFLRS